MRSKMKWWDIYKFMDIYIYIYIYIYYGWRKQSYINRTIQYPSVPIKYSQRSNKNSIKNNESVTFNEFVSE